MGYNPRDRKELDTAERLHFTSLHFCHSGAEHGTQTKDQATSVSPGNLLEMLILLLHHGPIGSETLGGVGEDSNLRCQ